MDTATLRWILIIAGLALLAGLFLFGNPNRKKPPKRRATRSRRKPRGGNRRKPRDEGDRQEPTLGTPAEFMEHEEGEGEGAQGELGIGAADEAAADGGDEREPETLPGPPPEKVMALYLQARDNRRIAGAELLEVALKSGMVFGPMDIFHRRQPGDERPVFSLANLTKPGHFDREGWNTMETKGVTLFMALPGPLGALDAWDAMLATARRLGQLLHLDLLDEKREPFTRQREGEIREELRSWERSRQPEG